MFTRSQMTRFLQLGIVILFAGLFLSNQPQTTQAVGDAQAAPPPQTTSLSVFHHSGQTFLTWAEDASLIGETYRIYRHNEPITSANLDSAALLIELGEGSSRFFANRYYDDTVTSWRYRHTERFVIQDLGAPLDSQTGLLVWTVGSEDFGNASSGNGYYAVTTVSYFGVENRVDFHAGNTTGAVSESVGAPEPVEINHSMGAGWHVYIQYMDLRHWNPTFHAPNSLNSHYGFSSNDVQVVNAAQYAYDYAVYQPGTAECGSNVPAQLPVIVSLHPFRGNNRYLPPDGHSSFCAYQIYPVDVMNTWWFGFAENYDYHAHQSGSYPGPGDTIVNFTEQRLLRMISDLARLPSGPGVDLNRVYVQGHSMGGSGALSLALRYGNVFAAADASKPMTNYRTTSSFFLNDISMRWGQPASNLPVRIDAPAGWAAHLQSYNGIGVWDWQNHQETIQTRVRDSMAPFGVVHSLNDPTMTWNTQGQPAYTGFNLSRQVWGAEIRQDRHDDASFIGLPPNLARSTSGVPFAGLQVPLNETMPGLSDGSASLPIPPSTTGNYNHTVMWSSSWFPWNGPPQETVSSWEISLCAVDASLSDYACGTGIDQTIDVTPRRTQQFDPAPGAVYSWENRQVSDGALIASGTVAASSAGVITVPDVFVSPSGVTLRIFSGSGSSTPTATASAPAPTPTPTNLPTLLPTATATTTAPPLATATPTATATQPSPPSTTPTNTSTSPPAVTPTPANTPPPTSAPPTATSIPGAGTTGWQSPSADSPGSGGDQNGFKIDPANAYADDGLFAADIDSGWNTRSTCNARQEESHLFYDFNFSIPANAAVTGIEARLDGWTDSIAGLPRMCVQFSWNGGGRWSEFMETSLTSTSETSYFLGGPNARWGWSWLPQDFNNGSFMMRVIMDSSSADRDFFLEWVAVQVHYQ